MTLNFSSSSWANDLNTYRDTFGIRNQATLKEQSHHTQIIGRTTGCPLGDDTHPLYCYGDEPPGDTSNDVQTLRYDRHGWNDTSLLQQGQNYNNNNKNQTHKHGFASRSGKKARPPSADKDGRRGLFGTLQMSDPGADKWLGNMLIDPTKGKRSSQAPIDPKGRKGLTQVLSQTQPGQPCDDSWLGNNLIDPARGKGSASTASNKKDLFKVIQQAPKQIDTKEREVDSWLGNSLIDPSKGKRSVKAPDEVHVLGARVLDHLPDADFPQTGKKPVDLQVSPGQAANDTVRRVFHGSGNIEDELGRRTKQFVPMPHAKTVDGRVGIKEILQNKSSQAEQQAWKQAWDDSGYVKRKGLDVPGSGHPSSGHTMLYWKPQENLTYYVPYGKLMQEQIDLNKSTQIPRQGRPPPWRL